MPYSKFCLLIFSHLFYFDALAAIQGNADNTTAVCTEKCPSENIVLVPQLQAWSIENNATLCRYDIPVASYSISKLGDTCPDLPIIQQ